MDIGRLSPEFRAVYEGAPPGLHEKLSELLTPLCEQGISPHVAIVCLLSHATMIEAASSSPIDSGELIRVLQYELDDTLALMRGDLTGVQQRARDV